MKVNGGNGAAGKCCCLAICGTTITMWCSPWGWMGTAIATLVIGVVTVPAVIGGLKYDYAPEDAEISFKDFRVEKLRRHGRDIRMTDREDFEDLVEQISENYTVDFPLRVDGNSIDVIDRDARGNQPRGFRVRPGRQSAEGDFVNRFIHYYLKLWNRKSDEKWFVQNRKRYSDVYDMVNATEVREWIKDQKLMMVSYTKDPLTDRNTFLGVFSWKGRTYGGTFKSLDRLNNLEHEDGKVKRKSKTDKKLERLGKKRFIGGLFRAWSWMKNCLSISVPIGIHIRTWVPSDYERNSFELWADCFGDELDETGNPDDSGNDDDKTIGDDTTSGEGSSSGKNSKKKRTFGEWWKDLGTLFQCLIIGGLVLLLIAIIILSYCCCCAADAQPQARYPQYQHGMV